MISISPVWVPFCIRNQAFCLYFVRCVENSSFHVFVGGRYWTGDMYKTQVYLYWLSKKSQVYISMAVLLEFLPFLGGGIITHTYSVYLGYDERPHLQVGCPAPGHVSAPSSPPPTYKITKGTSPPPWIPPHLFNRPPLNFWPSLYPAVLDKRKTWYCNNTVSSLTWELCKHGMITPRLSS